MEEKNNQESKSVKRKKLDRTLGSIGWGMFFIWIGVAFLANLGWGVGFIGVGMIVLGALVARVFLTNSAGSRTPEECC